MQGRTFWLTGLCLVVAIVGFQRGWFRKPERPAAVEAPTATVAAATPTAAEEPAPVPGSQRPELRVGDAFPFTKSVIQELAQSGAAASAVSQTRLDLLMMLTVEEVRDDRCRLGVQYQRVRYSRDFGGERLEYDSAVSGTTVPAEVLPYRGLAGNGFSFWLNADNQVNELVGFEAFIERCVWDVPPGERQAVTAALAARGHEGAVANFLDESIGLLPFGSAEPTLPTKAGDAWSRERKLTEPVPLQLSTRYSVRQADAGACEIEVLGNIVPPPTYAPDYAQVSYTPGEVDLRVRNGHTLGRCRIDRRTGLPLESRIERWLNMVVALPDGNQFEQRKKVVSILEALPADGPSSETGYITEK